MQHGLFARRVTIRGQTNSFAHIGGTNHQIDLQNPDNLGRQSTDAGVVPNLKWSFSDSRTRILNGGWVREQVVTDLPSSHDIAGAQQHLTKGSIRELHWHRVVRQHELLLIHLPDEIIVLTAGLTLAG